MTAWFKPPSARPLPGVPPERVAVEPTPLFDRIRSAQGLLEDDRPTEVLPIVAELRDLLSLADSLTALGARVEPVDRDPEGPCGWCSLEDREATVTVYGDPDPRWEAENPLRHVVVCTVCAPRAVHQAVVEQSPDSPRRIVAEIPLPHHNPERNSR